MSFFRTLQGRLGWRRIEQKIDEADLIFYRQTDEKRLFDRPLRGFLGGGDDEVADATAFDLGSTFHDGERLGSNARSMPPSAI